jgi:hypothetical protein
MISVVIRCVHEDDGRKRMPRRYHQDRRGGASRTGDRARPTTDSGLSVRSEAAKPTVSSVNSDLTNGRP